jgi:hypothetical protein
VSQFLDTYKLRTVERLHYSIGFNAIASRAHWLVNFDLESDKRRYGCQPQVLRTVTEASENPARDLSLADRPEIGKEAE